MSIYLDHAASTPLHPEVRQAVVRALDEAWGNASSVHGTGRAARKTVEEARESLAQAIGARSKEIIFTSGATEADNLALRGLAMPQGRGSLLTSRIEHSAVLSTARELERTGRSVVYLEPDRRGEITAEAVRERLTGDIGLVALMLVNNETGVRTDVREIARVAHENGALVFCDAVQAFGFEPLDMVELGVDAAAFSAHKVYGPKGVGALWVRNEVELRPIVHGGEQERGFRPGTHDTAAIAGLGAAARLAAHGAAEHGREVARLRDLFEESLADLEGLRVNGRDAPRGPKHSSVTIEGVDGEALLMSLDAAGVHASAGSACSAGSIQPSHVLTAMGLTAAEAKATVRFSFGAAAGEDEVVEAAATLRGAIERFRKASLV